MFIYEWIMAAMKISILIVFAMVVALPFSYAWNHIIPLYVPMMPELYQYLPWKDSACILLLLGIIGENIQKITPKIISVSNTNQLGKK